MLIKTIEELEEALDGIPADIATNQSRHFGLINSKKFCGTCLGELALGHQIPDSPDELGLGDCHFGIWDVDVGKDIAATGRYRWWLGV